MRDPSTGAGGVSTSRDGDTRPLSYRRHDEHVHEGSYRAEPRRRQAHRRLGERPGYIIDCEARIAG